MEWRQLLVHGKIQMNLEMYEYKGNQVSLQDRSVGVLGVFLELTPRTTMLKEG